MSYEFCIIIMIMKMRWRLKVEFDQVLTTDPLSKQTGPRVNHNFLFEEHLPVLDNNNFLSAKVLSLYGWWIWKCEDKRK